ncbi:MULTISPECIES: DegV family protein [unclassified Fusibacter]|uniref:DegV family protein n=1 Tax=unclassified Fusibacter TaxID=2624464 RepID=UPI001012C4A6|nr:MULTISPECIES: DegV family protein [unclassified Fusibacter]MCK8058498.1 DegV family EDD domain-containing protein [Fusibacter sp. A2]NPE22733.1 DegV family EDD domain-containing protein [Fusibacter sp. A1]RXV60292.1 DegV family EDD domain-containing protein [Fusibacter sp. A1]
MNTKLINGHDIYHYTMSGAKKIIHHENTLNSINVFPVADGDTGSNLAYTMKCIIANATEHETVSDTLSSISEVALEDAYGNSGAIFASFLHGLSVESKGKDSLSMSEFSDITNDAVKYAYDALAVPTEGTILTVIKEWAGFIKNQHIHHLEFKTLLLEATKHAKHALLETKKQLKVLRDSDVVDAGALGFVYFLEGIKDYFLYGKVHLSNNVNTSHKVVDHVNPNFQYCTEFIVEAYEHLDSKLIKEKLVKTDDSIIVQKIGDYYKIHTHTDHPDAAAKLVTKYGKIIKSKVDDMNLQVRLNSSSKSAIGIITDSIADIPAQWTVNKNVFQIPLQLIVDGNVYNDRLTLKNETLFDILKKTQQPATSSQPGETYLQKTFEFMLSHFEDVIGIFVSSEMSGMYQKAISVQSKIGSKHLHLFDSKTNSGAQALLVHTLIDQLESKSSITEVLSNLNKAVDSAKIFVEIPDLAYATLSGRVPKIVGNIASLLNLKAIISINDDGKGIVTKELNLKKLMVKKFQKSPFKKYGIVYTGNKENAIEYHQMMQELTGHEPVFIQEVSTIVSAFIGEGAIGIAYLED